MNENTFILNNYCMLRRCFQVCNFSLSFNCSFVLSCYGFSIIPLPWVFKWREILSSMAFLAAEGRKRLTQLTLENYGK